MPGQFNTTPDADGGFANTSSSSHFGFFASSTAITRRARSVSSPPVGDGRGGPGGGPGRPAPGLIGSTGQRA